MNLSSWPRRSHRVATAKVSFLLDFPFFFAAVTHTHTAHHFFLKCALLYQTFHTFTKRIWYFRIFHLCFLSVWSFRQKCFMRPFATIYNIFYFVVCWFSLGHIMRSVFYVCHCCCALDLISCVRFYFSSVVSARASHFIKIFELFG